MHYHEAANFLFERRQFRPKPGTESTRDLLAQVGNPDGDLTAIQIAGSNGKGSTARMTESILRQDGQSVGLYTSPHFDDVRERIQVDGRPIPKAAVTAFVEKVQEYVTERTAAGDPATFFEVTTAMALWYFAREGVDVAVLEVGIGGRFDATSVVEPAASAVTSVSLEHTELLGETLAEIARDKSHVAPRNGALVTGTTGEALTAVREQCEVLHAEWDTDVPPANQVLTVGAGDETADVTATYRGRVSDQEAAIRLAGPDWCVETRVPLLGAHQATNAGIAATLVKQLGPMGRDAIADGLRRATWPGRFEVMDNAPLTVLDGAHNPGACATLTSVLEEFTYERLHLVVGAMHDKDHPAMAAALPDAHVVYATKPVPDRAADPAALGAAFAETGVEQVEAIPSVTGAVDAAIAAAGPADCVVITGSLYTVSEARERWIRTTIPKRVDGPEQANAVLNTADVAPDQRVTAVPATVHRVLKTRVQQRQARWLEEELWTRGGAAVRSGLDDAIEENLDIVLGGTRDQFDSLFEAMAEAPDGLATLADDFAAALESDTVTGGGPPWADGPAIMGILNVTPDSFHDGGEYDETDAAVARARGMVADGAGIIDVGGESTRPGADPVAPATERERIIPVIEALAGVEAVVSVDTRKAEVADAAVAAGADLINDVSGLADPEMRFVAADHDVPLVVMHSIETPVDPDRTVEYDDVVEDVIEDLRERVLLAEKAGLDRSQIIVDPGLGFGKQAAESFELLGRCGELSAFGCPVMVGHSHKSMFGAIGRESGERFASTVAGTAIAAEAGADIIRVHDVEPNVAAVRAVSAAGGDLE